MQTANIVVDNGGDNGNQVPIYGATAAQIAVLIAIHGEGSVHDIEPIGDQTHVEIDGSKVLWTNRVELERVRRLYSRAKDGEDRAVVELMFPGMAARVFETFDEVPGLTEDLFKPTARAKAPVADHPLDHDKDGHKGGVVQTQAEGLAALTVAQLKELATKNNVDLGDATKKADIVAVLEEAAALAAEEDLFK